MINKGVRKSLAHKKGNENPIWSWNDSTTMSRPDEIWGPCPPSAVPPGGETLQGPSPTRGQDPCLGPKQEHRLHHRQIEPPCCSLIRSLPYQYLCQMPPLPLLPLEFLFHCRPIFVSGRQRLSQVTEQRDCCQQCTIL